VFQILTFIEARLATLTPRSEKHGDEDVPAVSLALEITCANTLLDVIDPKIRHSLYMAVEGQEQLPGVEPATPILRCNSFDRHTLPAKYEGWTMQIDDGIDDTKPMMFGGCKVDKFSVEAKQGGSVVLRMRVGTSDLDAERSGFLGMHVGQPVWITLTAPEKKPEAIDASKDAKDMPPDAGTLFAEAHGDGPGDDDADGEGDEPDVESVDKSSESPGDKSADSPIHIERSQPGTRTARGREKTKQALAAGAKH
jgi:hypothetical protein